MKTCNVCGIDKDDTCYGTSKGRNGEMYPRNTCKDCMNAKRRKNTTTNTPTIIKPTEIKETKKENNMINTDFTDKEILKVVLNKADRIHTVFNLDKDLRDNIKELADNKKLNMSDVANLILKRFFKNGN